MVDCPTDLIANEVINILGTVDDALFLRREANAQPTGNAMRVSLAQLTMKIFCRISLRTDISLLGERRKGCCECIYQKRMASLGILCHQKLSQCAFTFDNLPNAKSLF